MENSLYGDFFGLDDLWEPVAESPIGIDLNRVV
jgi:hypothetical protein